MNKATGKIVRAGVWAVGLAVGMTLGGCGVKKAVGKADRKYEAGEYYAAGNAYKRVIKRIPAKQKPLRAEVGMKMGDCFRKINNLNRAEYAYAGAVRNKSENPLAHLYYGDILKQNKKYKEAAVQYRLYADLVPDDERGKSGLEACDSMQAWNSARQYYTVKKIDVLSGKKSSEFGAAFGNEDGDILYFNSTRSGETGGKNSAITGLRNNDIYVSKRNATGAWDTPSVVEGELNTDADEGVVNLTADGKTLYFTRCEQSTETDKTAAIFSAQRSGAKWSGGRQVRVLADTTEMAAHPAISPDGRYLYFVSDREGGMGGKDLWRVEMTGTKWGMPENLGEDINTAGDEMFPFVRANGELYFASNGHGGFGGLDVFRAVETGEGHWRVENVGAPVNSPADDFGMVFAGKKDEGVFASTRGEARGYDKLWEFKGIEVEFSVGGTVVDTKNVPLADAVVRIVGDDGTNAKVRVKKDGTFYYGLKENVHYVMLITARGYLNRKESLATYGFEKGKAFNATIALASISKPVQVNNIFYESGKWTLTADSEAGLKDLVKILKDNPNVTMEIASHTDRIGSDADNKILSERRAKSVVDYLIGAGIEKDRIKPVGYGESVPVVVSRELARKYPFLKEGDTLTEEFVSAKSPSEQETCDAINRRTEFRVLSTTYNMY